MSLNFKSSGCETRVVIEREPDGRQRVARAVQSAHSRLNWDLRVEHPDGWCNVGSYNGDGANVVIALAEMLARSEHEYKSAKARGDKRPNNMKRDTNVSVD